MELSSLFPLIPVESFQLVSTANVVLVFLVCDDSTPETTTLFKAVHLSWLAAHV